MMKMCIFSTFPFDRQSQWSGYELPSNIWNSQLEGGRDPSQWSSRHPCQTASWSRVSQEGSTGWSSLWTGQLTKECFYCYFFSLCLLFVATGQTWKLSLLVSVSKMSKDDFSQLILMFLQPSADAVASESNTGQRLVIWGTDVNVGTCKEKFQVWIIYSSANTVFPTLGVRRLIVLLLR